MVRYCYCVARVHYILIDKIHLVTTALTAHSVIKLIPNQSIQSLIKEEVENYLLYFESAHVITKHHAWLT